MFQIRIFNTGVYRYPQKGHQTLHAVFLGLNVSGRVRSTLYDPWGRIYSVFDRSKEKTEPALTLCLPGFYSEFEYDETRENWVAMLAFPALEYLPDTREICWKHHGIKEIIPPRVPVKESELPAVREKFERMTALHQSGLPRNQLEAEIIALELMHYFLRTPVHREDPVEFLRKKLEEDFRKDCSITQISRELGISRDQLRKDFTERYNISPREFHTRVRLGKVLNLFAYSNLSLKEIAFAVGMKNLSHLTTFIRARCGKLPSELCREFRKSR